MRPHSRFRPGPDGDEDSVTSCEDKAADKRRRILDAAEQVFARLGFYEAKVADVAKGAGVADGTIYLYFKNKDDLLISLFENRMQHFVADLGERLAQCQNAREKLSAYIRFHMALAETAPDFLAVITLELRQSATFMKEYENPQFKRVLALLHELFCQGEDEGLFRLEGSPTVWARSLFGMVDETTRELVVMGLRGRSLEQLADELTGIFLYGIGKAPETTKTGRKAKVFASEKKRT